MKTLYFTGTEIVYICKANWWGNYLVFSLIKEEV